MDHTEEQRATFKRQFAERRRRQLILSVPLIALAVAFALLRDPRNGGALPWLPATLAAPAFLVVIGGALVFSFRNWRCPACDTYLGKGMSPRFCPKCGVALQ